MDMEKTLEFIAGSDQQGQRLDAALAALFPSLGLRGRRRLWKERQVLVDGLARSPAFKLRGGERIHLAPLCPVDAFSVYGADPPRLIARRESLFFFYKPGGLHTVSLAGGSKPSLAGLVDRLTPDASARLRLLTRLDRETSGIVIAAGDEDAARLWRQRENAGSIEKSYLAVLEGGLESEQVARNALDLTKTRRTRVLDADGPALRHTRIRPLACFQASGAPGLPSCPDGARLTLALCCIAKGARHQIRAHVAHIGHPLAGDALYGARSGSSFLLHHCRIQWPGEQAACLPPWLASLPAAVHDALLANVPFSCAWNESAPA